MKKEKISLREFHEALSKIGTAAIPGILPRKRIEPACHLLMVLKKGEKWKLNI